jgi:hypothetical protein
MGNFNPKWSRGRHVGRKPSKLMAKLTLGLRLQVFETSWGELQVFKLWGSHCKITETSWVKSEFSPNFNSVFVKDVVRKVVMS